MLDRATCSRCLPCVSVLAGLLALSALELQDHYRAALEVGCSLAHGAQWSPCCAPRAWAQAKSRAALEPPGIKAEGGDGHAAVAVALVGQLRSLHADVVLEHVQKELIRPLAADVFITGNTNETWVGELRKAGGGHGHLGFFKVLSTAEVLERLKPVGVRFYDSGAAAKVSRSASCRSRLLLFSQFWPFPLALAMILEAEHRRGATYTWVVRSRPDMTFSGRPVQLPWTRKEVQSAPPTVFGQAYFHGCLFCDAFQLATRSAFEALFSVDESFRRCEEVLAKQPATICWCCNGQCHQKVHCGYGRDMDGSDTECTILRHLHLRNVTINTSMVFLLQTHRLRLALNFLGFRSVITEHGPSCPFE